MCTVYTSCLHVQVKSCVGVCFINNFFFLIESLKSTNVNLVSGCLQSEEIKWKSVKSLGCSGARLCSYKVFDIWQLYKAKPDRACRIGARAITSKLI